MPSSKAQETAVSTRTHLHDFFAYKLTFSRLYSEKAYVLSRGFIKQALAWPQAGLENEIRHYYLTKGHLKEVIDHARVLMEKEAPRDEDEAEERWDADVIGSLTAGAKLSLKVNHPFS